MKYCSDCGQTVELRIPDGDDRQRHVCSGCGIIHYLNPRIIVGTLPVFGDKVLLCRRAIEPRKGYWTLPAGFMENGETTIAGAVRETWEEARAKLSGEVLYRLFDLPYINQVYIFYRAELVGGQYAAGPESLEVALFDEADIPWTELAFPVVSDVLKEYLVDRQQGHYPVRVSGVDPQWFRERGLASLVDES